ncbi:MAG: hypothetical protein ACMVO3_08855 [Thalassobaculum sp.]
MASRRSVAAIMTAGTFNASTELRSASCSAPMASKLACRSAMAATSSVCCTLSASTSTAGAFGPSFLSARTGIRIAMTMAAMLRMVGKLIRPEPPDPLDSDAGMRV